MAVAERLRRTMMFVPGNNPAMIKDAGIFEADSIMFDLEDAVSLAEKDAARVLVYEAVKNYLILVGLNWSCESMVWTRHFGKKMCGPW